MKTYPKEDSAKIVKQALSFERPDRIPVFDGFWEEFIVKWRAQKGIAPDCDIEDYYWIDLKVPVAHEQFFPSQVGPVRREGNDVFLNDGWGRVVRTRENAHFTEPVEHAIRDKTDLDRLEFEPTDMGVRYEDLVKQVDSFRGKGRAVFVKIGGVFIRSSFLRGEVDFLMDIAADESFARAIAEKVGDHLLHIGLESLKRTGTEDFGVWVYDDMANINSTMFSPASFEKIFMDVYKKIISELKKAGARWVILHSDGNIGPVLDMLIEAGIDGINPVEHAAGLDVVKLKKKYGNKLSYIGGLCNTHILPGGDKQQIRRHVEEIVEVAEDGGIIIGSHSVGPDITLESYEFYRDVLVQKGNYSRKD